MSALAVLTSIVARRGAGTPFAATRYAIEPSPCPLLAEVSTIHWAVFDAAQAQSRAAVTVSDPAPPPAGILSSELVTVTPQRAAPGAVTDVCDDVHDAPTTANSNTPVLTFENSPAVHARAWALIGSTRADVVQVAYLRQWANAAAQHLDLGCFAHPVTLLEERDTQRFVPPSLPNALID